MNEEQWLTSTDPTPMLEFLRAGVQWSERKVRLLSVAVCRRIWHLMRDERSWKAVEVLERYADGMTGIEELTAAALAAIAVAEDAESTENPYAAGAAANSVHAELPPEYWGGEDDEDSHAPTDCISSATDAAFAAAWATGHAHHPEDSGDAWFAATKAEEADQCTLLCEIFGNPFHPPPAINPSWLAWNDGAIKKMAVAIYQEKAFEQMPLLADALEDAGCTNKDILAHCREQGVVHVRGRWVIDLRLGKS